MLCNRSASNDLITPADPISESVKLTDIAPQPDFAEGAGFGEVGLALDRLAAIALRLQHRAPPRGPLRVSALPTFAMRWLIPRLPEFQRDPPSLELQIVTASTPAEQFRMDVDAVISGPSRYAGWRGQRFLGEARLPVLSPELMERCPLRMPADLDRHTLLHSATLRAAWPRWLTAANVPDLRPTRDQVFEHFYFCNPGGTRGAWGRHRP
jgi:LysR family transcriptional regulator, glycine cleavage system transcriptional activator